MNDLVTSDLTQKITLALLQGQNPHEIAEAHSCALSQVYEVLGSVAFSQQVKDFLQRDIQISGVIALKNIKKIAEDNTGSKATQLKANQWLAEKALEINRLGNLDDSPATMTQDQLARRLKTLQAEANKRAIPIDTGVLDNMLE